MTLSNRKVGGLRFLRFGKLQLSFCVVRSAPAPRKAKTFDQPRLRSVAVGSARVFIVA